MKFSFAAHAATFGLAITLPFAAVAASDNTGAAKAEAAVDWQKVVNFSDKGGHVMGNPDAAFKIVEYASYTCGHCGQFEVVDAPLLKANEVAFGNVSFEMRNLIRDGKDLTVAVLARCGGKDKFFASHKYWMSTQAEWYAGSTRITPETEEKLQKRDLTGYVAGIYGDMRLAPHAAKTGLTDMQAKACLADTAMLKSVLDLSNDATGNLKINATPTFLVNGVVAPTAYNYPTLKPLLVKK